MLTFEGTQVQGADAIVEKLKVRARLSYRCVADAFLRQSLPFQKVQHKVETRDAQPTGADGTSLAVMVTGALVVSAREDKSTLDPHYHRRLMIHRNPCASAKYVHRWTWVSRLMNFA